MPLVDLTIDEIKTIAESLDYSCLKIEDYDYCYGHYNEQLYMAGVKRKQDYRNIFGTIILKLKEAQKRGIS